jgi:hypothetical protein
MNYLLKFWDTSSSAKIGQKNYIQKHRGKMHITSQGGNFYGSDLNQSPLTTIGSSHKQIMNQNLGEKTSGHISCSLFFFQLSPLSHKQHVQVQNHSYRGELLKHLASERVRHRITQQIS